MYKNMQYQRYAHRPRFLTKKSLSSATGRTRNENQDMGRMGKRAYRLTAICENPCRAKNGRERLTAANPWENFPASSFP